MLKMFRKAGVVLVSGSLILATGCSFLGGSSKKPNTKAPEVILKEAKTDIASNFKTSLKDAFDKYEKDYLKTFAEWPSTGDWTFTVKADAGDQGKFDVSLNEKYQMDSGSFDDIDLDSSLLEIIKSVKGQADIEIKAKADVAPFGEMEASANLTIAETDGVYYAQLNSVVVPDGLPGGPSQAEVDAMLSQFKGKWYKIDVAGLIESNPLMAQVFEMKLRDFNNVNPEAMTKLFGAYIDDVILKQDWMEVSKDSKKDTDKGDQYKVVFTKDKIEEFLLASYDFVNENLEDVDAVFDITQSRNPLMMAPVMTVADLKKEMTDSRESFESGLSREGIEDIPFLATFSGDKLVVFGFRYDVPDDSDVTGYVEANINFEDGKHDLDYSNIDVVADITPENVEGHFKLDGTLNVADGKERKSDLKVELNIEGGKLVGSLNTVAIHETKKLKSLGLNIDFDSDEELEAGMTGFKVDFNIDNDGDTKIDGGFTSVPDGKLVDVSLDGKFSKNDGNGKIEFTVNPPGASTVSGALGLDYTMSDKSVNYELPAETKDAQDFTGDIQQLLSGGLMMTPAASPDAMTLPDGTMVDPNNMTEEDIQKMIDSGAFGDVPVQ